MSTETPSPSKQLYLRVRAGFVQQELSLSAWCRQNGIDPTNARHALIGSWDGPKGRKLRARIVKASGIGATVGTEAKVA
jgi:hypothetical protein